jgi:regulator of ribonuclease activity A
MPARLEFPNNDSVSPMEKTTCDLCDEYPAVAQVAQPLFHSYGGIANFSGCIATIKCHEDISRVRELVERDGRQKVLVIDGGGSVRRALLGDQLAAKAVAHGWQGIVINGAVRDIEVMATLPIGVQAIGHIPARPANDGTGEQGVSVRFAGIHFVPGHFLYADRNGIVVAPHALT